MQVSSSELSALIDRYGGTAPRYTSYPTPPDWQAWDGARTQQGLEQAARSRSSFALYVHLPFCAQRCLFCGCNVAITRDSARVDRYLDRLLQELELVGRTGLLKRPVSSVHLGGGTPTHLSLAQLERLLSALESACHPEPGVALSLEADPRVTEVAQLALLHEHGFRRVSFGVQDLDPDVLRAVGRECARERVEEGLSAARSLGYSSVNVDLIYGLPLQTRASFARTIAETVELGPDRIALFHYAHVPWMKKHQGALERWPTPDPLEKLRIFEDARSALEAAGYVHLGLDHFAREDDALTQAYRRGQLGRDFMGYTERRARELLALGASGIGEMGGCYLQNEPDVRAWEARIEAGELATVRGYAPSQDDVLRGAAIRALMCNGRLEKARLETLFAIDFDLDFRDELSALRLPVQDGLVRLTPQAIEVTRLGRLFLRNLASVFDRYLAARSVDAGAGRFSRTH